MSKLSREPLAHRDDVQVLGTAPSDRSDGHAPLLRLCHEVGKGPHRRFGADAILKAGVAPAEHRLEALSLVGNGVDELVHDGARRHLGHECVAVGLGGEQLVARNPTRRTGRVFELHLETGGLEMGLDHAGGNIHRPARGLVDQPGQLLCRIAGGMADGRCEARRRRSGHEFTACQCHGPGLRLGDVSGSPLCLDSFATANKPKVRATRVHDLAGGHGRTLRSNRRSSARPNRYLSSGPSKGGDS